MRKVYIYSTKNDYIQKEYIDIFKAESAELVKGTVQTLKEFIKADQAFQLDLESNVTNNYLERELYVIQLGDVSGENQHVIDYRDADKDTITELKKLLRDRNKVFIAHNGMFEYLLLHKEFGIDIFDIHDTFLMSKLLVAGISLEAGFNGLKHQTKLRLGIEMSKDEQTTFDGNKMTANQLLYATTDVVYMGKLMAKLLRPLKKWKLMKVYNLERRAIRPIADMTINGALIDTDALDENIKEFEDAEKVSRDTMKNIMINEKDADIRSKMLAINAIQPFDEVLINWGSPKQKKLILSYFYPDHEITSSAVAALTKLMGKVDDPSVIETMLNKGYDKLNGLLVSRHMDFLKSSGMFIEKGTININFNSPSQLLELFKIWYVNLSGVGVKDLKKLSKSPLIEAYKKNAKASKLVSSFGRKMYDYIGDDGRIHGSFTQLVPSGSRMSSSRPNLQQMPSTESYRRIFVPRPGWKYVDADYASAELFIAAALSGDKNMWAAIKAGADLHSYSAFLIFGKEWLDAGGDEFQIGKPKTSAANKLRKAAKALSFSLLYGTGVQALSENLSIKQSEGKELMARYYGAFPELAAFFKKSGREALDNGYVVEPFFGRIRFFDKPTNGMEVSHNKNAGMNFKPQACNASITKYAMVLIKNYIEEHALSDKVKIVLAIHDQLLIECKETFADDWSKIQTKLMEKAALPVLPNGELKAESMILDHWTK